MPRLSSATWRITLAALLAGATVAVGVGLLIAAIVDLRRDTDAASRSQQVLLGLSRTERLAVDLETGIRGYVITGQSRFLAPYEGARLALPQTIAQLRGAVAGDRRERSAVARLDAQIADYVSSYAAPLVRRVPHHQAATRTTAVTAAGKARLDAIRRILDTLRGRESVRQAIRRRQARHSSDRALAEGFAVLAILVIAVGLFAVVAVRLLMGRERARQGATFLAEAGEVLDTPLDLDETLGAFSRLAVPALADWCTVDLFDERGDMRTVAVTHRDPERTEQAAALRAGLRRLVARGEPDAPRLVGTITDHALRELVPEEDRYQAARALGLRSAMMVPLIARGRNLGSVTFGASSGGRSYDRDDLVRAAELGRRVALAVDTARLLRRSEQTASVLQASLLPQALPDIPGCELQARFLPAGEGTLVGGDFFDVFPAGPRRWALVVGDVCGKGAPAAALTGMARYTLRALASDSLSPAGALERLNAAMLEQDLDQRFITMTYAAVELPAGDRPGVARVRVACAGHPPPILVGPPDRGETVAADGRLLGVWAELMLTEAELELSPGDALALYSDGVTDRGPGRGQLPEDLARAVAGSGDAGRLADALQAIALGRGDEPQRDDVAILVLRRLPGGALRPEPEGRPGLTRAG